jgi:hypothetical protein
MMRRRWLPLAFVAVSATACYHQVVNTGRTAGTTKIELPWVQGWLFGLVSPQPIETRAQCPSGVATVVTEQSFPNMLVGFVTLGIYTPQHVTITCATGGTASLPKGATELTIPADATTEQRSAILGRAIELSAEQHAAVVLRF